MNEQFPLGIFQYPLALRRVVNHSISVQFRRFSVEIVADFDSCDLAHSLDDYLKIR